MSVSIHPLSDIRPANIGDGMYIGKSSGALLSATISREGVRRERGLPNG